MTVSLEAVLQTEARTEVAPLVDYPQLVSQARERIKRLEVNIESILDRTAVEKRPCNKCGVMLWFVNHRNGKWLTRVAHTVDGTNHRDNCRAAARLGGTKA